MPDSPPAPGEPDEIDELLAEIRPRGVPWPPPGWLRLLFRGRGVAAHLTGASARAAPTEAVPWLAAIIDDDDLCSERAVGDGYAPLMAALALRGIPAPEAIDALIRTLARTEEDEDLHLAALDVLTGMGTAAIEPLIAARTASPTGSDAWYSLTCALAEFRSPHPRIREVLLEVLAEDEELGAELCGLSGDPALIPALRARWDAYVVDGSDEANGRDGAGLRAANALLDLNAPWSDDDEAKLRQILLPKGGAPGAYEDPDLDDGLDDAFDDDGVDERDLLREDLRAILDDSSRLKRPDGTPLADAGELDDLPVDPLARRGAPGRNDPCWCGSGKKYKKCHLDTDERD